MTKIITEVPKLAASLLKPSGEAPVGTTVMWIGGAPICADVASPLRVATGGNANSSSKTVATARPSAQINGAMTSRAVRSETRTGSESAVDQQVGPNARLPLNQIK
jgi:hypothetical protein